MILNPHNYQRSKSNISQPSAHTSKLVQCTTKKQTYGQFLPVERDLDAPAGPCDVVRSAGQKSHDVFVQFLHLELGQVGLERHDREVLSVEELDLRLRGF